MNNNIVEWNIPNFVTFAGMTLGLLLAVNMMQSALPKHLKDKDRDGVPDIIDLDDDNDGELDIYDEDD